MVMTEKGADKETSYVLVNQKLLRVSNFYLPELYLNQYFGWYSSQENTIVFRKKTLK